MARVHMGQTVINDDIFLISAELSGPVSLKYRLRLNQAVRQLASRDTTNENDFP